MRWITGVLLVGAALLKGAELLTDPAFVLVHPWGRYFLSVEIILELAAGLLVLSGAYLNRVRWGVLVLFSGFAAYSFVLAVRGAASCGCFGPLKVNPWGTFGLDCAVVVGLLLSAVKRSGKQRSTESTSGQIPRKYILPRWATILGMSLVVVGSALLLRLADRQTVSAEGIITFGNLVIVEPEKWTGKPLPIAASIDRDLTQGNWTVLIHRHDCPVCQELVPQFEQHAERGERIALVEVPPYGVDDRVSRGCVYARLKNDREWFVETPLIVELKDGFVTTVNAHGHSAAN